MVETVKFIIVHFLQNAVSGYLWAWLWWQGAGMVGAISVGVQRGVNSLKAVGYSASGSDLQCYDRTFTVRMHQHRWEVVSRLMMCFVSVA